MREITVISGKGGTGKSSLTACFAHLSEQSVIVDLDVDAADLHIILDPFEKVEERFISGEEYSIDTEKCVNCGYCKKVCNFNALEESDDQYFINHLSCESCGVCEHFCPAGAIISMPKDCGVWTKSESRFGKFVYARLNPGEENSGRLVTLLRKESKKIAEANAAKFIINDGSPGIGCPVISSLSGVDLAVVITEPTPSGLHDMKRVLDLCGHFSVNAVVVINKFDLNLELTEEIEKYCDEKSLQVISKVSFDEVFVKAMNSKQAITEFSNSEISRQISLTWKKIEEVCDERCNSGSSK